MLFNSTCNSVRSIYTHIHAVHNNIIVTIEVSITPQPEDSQLSP